MITPTDLRPRLCPEGTFVELSFQDKHIEVTAVPFTGNTEQFGNCRSCVFHNEAMCHSISCDDVVYLTKTDYLTYRLTK